MRSRLERYIGKCSSRRLSGLFFLIAYFIIASTPAVAKGFQSPEECLAYSGEAHLNCLYAYIEVQQDTIVKLESKLQKEQQDSQKLRDNINRQLSLNEALRQGINERERSQTVYRYPQIGLYSGFSYGFGRNRYHRRFFEPRFGFHFGPYYPIW